MTQYLPAWKVYEINRVKSTNCTIQWNNTKLFIRNNYTGQIEEYTEKNVTVDYTGNSLRINTTLEYYLELLVYLKTKGSDPYYWPISVNVTKAVDFTFNLPPHFINPNPMNVSYIVDWELDPYIIYFNLTKPFDDHNNISWLNVSSEGFGKVKYRITPDT